MYKPAHLFFKQIYNNLPLKKIYNNLPLKKIYNNLPLKIYNNLPLKRFITIYLFFRLFLKDFEKILGNDQREKLVHRLASFQKTQDR